MRVKLLTYYTKNFKYSAFELIKSAKKFGIDEIVCYDERNYKKTDFYKKKIKINKISVGAGSFLWKVFYLHKEYFELKENEILFYADAGSNFISSAKPLIDLCKKKDIVLFNLANAPKNRTWCKRDTFFYMNCDLKQYHDGPHLGGAFQIYKRCEKNDLFMNEFFHYAQDIRIISNIPNEGPKQNFQEFSEHRFAQCILSIMAIKYNIESFRDPTQWGNYMKTPEFRTKKEWLSKEYEKVGMENSPYPTIINHHRNKNKIYLKFRYMMNFLLSRKN